MLRIRWEYDTETPDPAQACREAIGVMVREPMSHHFLVIPDDARKTMVVDLAPKPGDDFAVVWVCPTCGSDDVEETAWRKINTSEVTSSGADGPLDKFFCNRCNGDISRVVPIGDFKPDDVAGEDDTSSTEED
jgi:hypothetical protein